MSDCKSCDEEAAAFPVCAQASEDGLLCTEPVGHDGAHVACGRDDSGVQVHALDTWSSYGVEATDGSGYAPNQLRFASRLQAEVYAEDLASRWTACRATRIRTYKDEVNAES